PPSGRDLRHQRAGDRGRLPRDPGERAADAGGHLARRGRRRPLDPHGPPQRHAGGAAGRGDGGAGGRAAAAARSGPRRPCAPPPAHPAPPRPPQHRPPPPPLTPAGSEGPAHPSLPPHCGTSPAFTALCNSDGGHTTSETAATASRYDGRDVALERSFGGDEREDGGASTA